jgi:hypothetical protein
MKAILTKYFGPSNVRGSRVKAYDMDGNQITISYDDSEGRDNAHLKAANALLAKMGWTDLYLVGGAIKGGFAFVMIRHWEV